jgi:hypothetical protein
MKRILATLPAIVAFAVPLVLPATAGAVLPRAHADYFTRTRNPSIDLSTYYGRRKLDVGGGWNDVLNWGVGHPADNGSYCDGTPVPNQHIAISPSGYFHFTGRNQNQPCGYAPDQDATISISGRFVTRNKAKGTFKITPHTTGVTHTYHFTAYYTRTYAA